MNASPQIVVVDANVCAKVFLEEENADKARALFSSNVLAVAPDFIAVEVGSVFRKKILDHSMTEADALLALEQVPTLVRLQSSARLAPMGLAIALTHRRSFYDSLYVALAVQESCEFVTGDDRLINSIGQYYPGTFRRLLDLPSP